MSGLQGPEYSLSRIKDLIRGDEYRISDTAAEDAAKQLGFGEQEILECVLGLRRGRDHSRSFVDKYSLVQDEYRTNHLGESVFIKVRVNCNDRAVVISCKEDDTSHTDLNT